MYKYYKLKLFTKVIKNEKIDGLDQRRLSVVWAHRHLSNIDCLTARTTCLVCHLPCLLQ